ncbi:MAG TPA: hypothetical protein VL307_20410 [Chitinophagaceae bacterium]|nr:hypothetical protein [Chitinophagaceae bacterium]
MAQNRSNRSGNTVNEFDTDRRQQHTKENEADSRGMDYENGRTYSGPTSNRINTDRSSFEGGNEGWGEKGRDVSNAAMSQDGRRPRMNDDDDDGSMSAGTEKSNGPMSKTADSNREGSSAKNAASNNEAKRNTGSKNPETGAKPKSK